LSAIKIAMPLACSPTTGLPLGVYKEWIASEGTVQCSAITTKGRRCGNWVSGRIQLPPDIWMERQGEYCAVHGGRPSEPK
jgi:hypothetical protein